MAGELAGELPDELLLGSKRDKPAVQSGVIDKKDITMNMRVGALTASQSASTIEQ